MDDCSDSQSTTLRGNNSDEKPIVALNGSSFLPLQGRIRVTGEEDIFACVSSVLLIHW